MISLLISNEINLKSFFYHTHGSRKPQNVQAQQFPHGIKNIWYVKKSPKGPHYESGVFV
jgi:hypothetical protein